MPREIWAGRTIDIIENPSSDKIIRKLARQKFTGLIYYPGSQQPWRVWCVGKLITATKTKEEAIACLV
ncbi:MAG: hypothetical protein A2Z78_01790 [Candidatus Nealsonbacteria bacterium RBG_13_36_15]|uniref:Uncharacterized protein n=1 Tax=Candidatus Nealsonbacteria bacterium RBG_13_36_15 TaxID=1801660 RepID=A0A1G2DWI0_9BACT|nr:MAG: hypothetical protein A2Z78_01790 [Candidatus Nealsonbacteria bacterium RBG_13_36_15]